MSTFYQYEHINDTDIAIIAMSCRFPGADNVEAFWRNLHDGVESISFFSEEELVDVGIDPELVKKPNYVRAKGVLSDVELFDASFFGFSPREAAQMDPQHRLFLEEAWKIIETSGYHPDLYEGLIGLYAGIGMNTYLLNNLSTQRQQLEATSGIFPLLIGNDKDYMPTKASYKLNLKGPSVNVQTACSTSLVATHLACQALLNGECDMALAGGVSLQIPHKSGYLYQEGMILSPDGHCRAFDANAKGIVYGNGVGIIMLKRLADAIADGDEIHAIIKGSAINNDGSLKVAYTAPGVDGQAAVIAEAQAVADVDPETITYIETHGTGTALGDPIEIAALTKAFREQSQALPLQQQSQALPLQQQSQALPLQFCAIGSVKTNVGHLDTAAGVAGVVKTVLALKHRQIPPSLNFEAPNPQIDFASTPFYVNAKLTDWNSEGRPRRAGVSSFGFGGTNAHIILEEAPPRQNSGQSRPAQLLVISAKSESALETATTNLATHLEQHSELNLADAAYTLQIGRHVFNHRRTLVCQDRAEAIKLLKNPNSKQVSTQVQEPAARPVVFLFPGQGAQYVNMARELYDTEETFHNCVDDCAEQLEPLMGLDLRTILYPDPDQSKETEQQLQQTAVTQPAIFVIEYALAQLLMEWGIQPQAVVGHSIGEFTAACIAGVFSLEDALKLVVARGQLMQSCDPGAMLSVSLPENEVLPLLTPDLSIAALNAPNQSVVSGPTETIEVLQQTLAEKKISGIRLHTSHAFHSPMMDSILRPFADILKKVALNPPHIGWVSTVTGNWITAEEATEPSYWTKNLRQTVRFADAVQQLFDNPSQILLEVGPGRTLSTLASRHPKKAKEQVALSSLRHPQSKETDVAFLLGTVGKLWLEGVQIDWNGFYNNENRYRFALPTYPFERKKYWIEPQEGSKATTVSEGKKPDIADWFYLPTWKRIPLLSSTQFSDKISTSEKSTWLLFADDCGISSRLQEQLQQYQQNVISVHIGETFDKQSDRELVLHPSHQEGYDRLFEHLHTLNHIPNRIVHLWNVTEVHGSSSIFERLDEMQERGLYSLLALAKAIGKQNISHEVRLTVVSNNMHDVIGGELLFPEKATLLGPVKIIPQEYPSIQCCSIDFDLRPSEKDQFADQILSELLEPSSDLLIAYRGPSRWLQHFEPIRLEQPQTKVPPRLRKHGVYLITGGLGGIGLTLARYLAEQVQARLVLTGRSALPPQAEWETWVAAHDSEDRTSQKILKVQELQKLGAEVLVFQADAASFTQMETVVTQAQQQFGEIHGVLHCAGVPDYAGVIQRRTREDTAQILAPKVSGTLILDQLLQQTTLDFMILFSSIGTILYKIAFGQIGYCSANEFLDAFSFYNATQKKKNVISINWSAWKDVGMAEEARKHWIQVHNISANKDNVVINEVISPKEGVEIFIRILGMISPRVSISTQDLPTLIKRDAQAASTFLKATEEAHLAQEVTHARPDISAEYTAPVTTTEKTLVELWQQFLGISQIGIHDDFFELGGDSLLGTQILSRIRETFQVDLPIGRLFEHPTVAGIAVYLEEREEGEI